MRCEDLRHSLVPRVIPSVVIVRKGPIMHELVTSAPALVAGGGPMSRMSKRLLGLLLFNGCTAVGGASR